MAKDEHVTKTEIQKEFENAVESGEENKILTVFRKIFLNAIELKITTTVTSTSSKSIHTTINLLEGDITTTMHSEFASDPQTVANFHKEQVNKAEQIIERNVNTLKNLASTLMDMR